MIQSDEDWMWRTLHLAREAEKLGEVPIGAIIIDGKGKILAATSNRTITDSDPTAHAELMAIRTAGMRIGNYRLNGTTMYSTIEPCVMCAGAAHQSRLSRVVFGAFDLKAGALGSLYNVGVDARLNHEFAVDGGLMPDECAALVSQFFARRRA